MSKKNIDQLIKEFDKLRLHFKTPNYTKKQLEEMEKNLKCKFPPDFKKTLEAGYIDKGTFYFLPPERFENDERFLIFGKWNDNVFMFDTEAGIKDMPVYEVVKATDKPEKCFENFYEWLNTVLKSVASAHFPG